MKKILIIAAVALLVAAAGIAIFIATFDINKYKPQIEAQLSSSINNTVKIDKLFLSFKGGIMLGMDGLRVFDQAKGMTNPVIEVEKVQVAVALMPLLTGHVQIDSALIQKPRLHIISEKTGGIHVDGIKAAASSAVTTGNNAAAAIPAAVRLSRLELQKGEVRFEDLAMSPAVDISLRQIDAVITDVAFDRPMHIDVKMAVFSPGQDLAIKGTLEGITGPAQSLSDFTIKFDLSSINYDELVKSVPQVKASGLKPGIGGQAVLNITSMTMTSGSVTKLNADVSLTDAKVVMLAQSLPISAITLKSHMTESQLVISELSAALPSAAMKMTGTVDDPFAKPKSHIKASFDVASLSKFTAAASGQKAHIDGKMSLSFEGTATGQTQDEIMNTVSGSGMLSIDNGIILNGNLLAQSLGGINIFPGLVDMVSSLIPKSIADALKGETTILQPIRQAFVVQNGVTKLDPLTIGTPFADIKGTASVDRSGQLTGSGTISFADELTKGLVKAVAPLSSLKGSKGLVEFPITFKVGPKGTSAMPDLGYIAKKTILGTGTEAVQGILEKITSPSNSASATPSDASAPKPSTMDTLKGLFKK